MTSIDLFRDEVRREVDSWNDPRLKLEIDAAHYDSAVVIPLRFAAEDCWSGITASHLELGSCGNIPELAHRRARMARDTINRNCAA